MPPRASIPDPELPRISIIIAARLDDSEVKSARAARQFDYPTDKFEIILARGRQPSAQRNRAAAVATGEIIYFLDDDSVAQPQNLQLIAATFRDANVQIVGGPNLCPDGAPPLERAFAATMGTPLAFGPSAARYRSAGAPRQSSEKELILCNLAFRRSAFTEHGGFDEALYPNEENALMDAIQKRGGRLIYDPGLIVHRRPRSTLRAFIRMLLNYGRGRAEQFRLHPTMGSAANFVPPLFCLYLAAIPFLPDLLRLPLAFYGVAVLVQAIIAAPQLRLVPLVAIFVFLTHLFYGLGFWRGLFTRPRPPSAKVQTEIRLEHLQPQG